MCKSCSLKNDRRVDSWDIAPLNTEKAERRNYSKMRYDVDLPNLIEIQTLSFDEFIKTGINELLKIFHRLRDIMAI